MAGEGRRQTASTLGRQLRFDVYPADGALLVGEEPLVHTQLMEEVHTRQAPGQETQGGAINGVTTLLMLCYIKFGVLFTF